jgi:CubicO group peptidase (beta-lactamase class C family)
MKSQSIVFFLFLFAGAMSHGQIDFTKTSLHSTLQQKAVQADKAISDGDYGDVHSLLVVKEGKLVFEKYYRGWKVDSVHQAQSMTKSVVSTLLGLAIQQEFVKSTEDAVVTYFSQYKNLSDAHKKIKISDLLTQRHGLKWSERPWNSPDNTWRKVLNSSGDWYKQILQTDMATTPGTQFNYSNAAPVLVSGIVQNASGLQIDQFAKKYLFDPLEISNYRFWQGNGGPQHNGMAMIHLTSRAIAKIGQLYLQNGVWNGEPLLSKDFVAKATSPIVKEAEGNPIYQSYDYGYFWWSNPVSRNQKKYTVFLARGAGGQLLIVEPKRQLIVVITAWNLTTPNKVQVIFDRYFGEGENIKKS